MLELLLPPRCVLCETDGGGLCRRCAAALEPPSPQPPPAGLDALVSLCEYRGAGRDLVLALKRRNRRSCLPLLGAALAEVLPAALTPAPGEPRCDAPVTVSWAPTTDPRRRRRGFDQSEMVARAVAAAGRWPVQGLLKRSGPAQMGRSRDQRRAGVGFAPCRPVPQVVVVLDDVVTSGATMSAAAQALRQAGAIKVVGGAVAVTAAAATAR